MNELLKQLFGDMVTDDVLKQFNTELGKRFVAKSDYNTKLEEIKTLNGKITNYEQQIKTLSENANNSDDWKDKFEKLQKEIEDNKIAEQNKQAEKELTEAIESVFGDKKFSSDYVRNGIIADMKSEIAKSENKGKGYAEIFEALTKDKEGIFANPNPPAPMTGMGNVGVSEITKEQFNKMGYSERNQLFHDNQELYNKLKES